MDTPNNLLADLFTDRALTQPWADDEYLVLDGRWRLVYSADKKNGITLVHLYGRRALTLQQLREAGHEIAMPKRIRCGA